MQNVQYSLHVPVFSAPRCTVDYPVVQVLFRPHVVDNRQIGTRSLARSGRKSRENTAVFFTKSVTFQGPLCLSTFADQGKIWDKSVDDRQIAFDGNGCKVDERAKERKQDGDWRVSHSAARLTREPRNANKTVTGESVTRLQG